MKPLIKSGKLVTGADCLFGDNVVIDVDEEVVLGDRCTIGDGTVFSGRRVEVGDDFYGYSWSHPVDHGAWTKPASTSTVEWAKTPIMRGWLDVGSGRRGEEHAVLTVGKRCTFHDNRIDLARRVDLGDDVGLSPEVVIYTHGYWQSVLHGYPCSYKEVTVGSGTIVGFRSVLLPGAAVWPNTVIGACSTVCGRLPGSGVYAGCPAKLINGVFAPGREVREMVLANLMAEYLTSLQYRDISAGSWQVSYPKVEFAQAIIDVEACTLEGTEDERTDDLRDFLFKRGIRIYTKRRFKKMRGR